MFDVHVDVVYVGETKCLGNTVYWFNILTIVNTIVSNEQLLLTPYRYY